MTAYLIVSGIVILLATGIFAFQTWTVLKHAIAVTLTAVFLMTSVGVSYATWSVGTTIDRNSTLKYKEFWNGFETEAKAESIECRRDGRCMHTYDCDPYQVLVTDTDSDGDTYTKMETRYHSCPYSKEETTYSVDTTLGHFVYAAGVLTGEPFRKLKRIPQRLATETPKEWLDAKKRLDKGEPRGVTQLNTYDNYLLGADSDLQKRYAGDVDALLEKDLLPDMPVNTFEHYRANKVHAINYEPKHGFFEDVENINGALGVDSKQGDLHVVFVNTDTGVNPDTYGNAVMAHWQGKEFKRNALAKNAIVIVMGVDSDTDTVEWARGYTGMPVGNTALSTAVMHRLPGLPADESLLGRPSYDMKTETVKHSDGALETILWDSTAGFERVSMSGSEEDDIGSGFLYLEHSIKTSTVAIILMSIANVVFLVFLFIGAGRLLTLLEDRERGTW